MKKWLTINKYVTCQLERFFWVMLGFYALSLFLAPGKEVNALLLSINYFVYRIAKELISKGEKR